MKERVIYQEINTPENFKLIYIKQLKISQSIPSAPKMQMEKYRLKVDSAQLCRELDIIKKTRVALFGKENE
jgi:hypothetical protein